MLSGMFVCGSHACLFMIFLVVVIVIVERIQLRMLAGYSLLFLNCHLDVK